MFLPFVLFLSLYIYIFPRSTWSEGESVLSVEPCVNDEQLWLRGDKAFSAIKQFDMQTTKLDII